jgi:transcriptional regulator with XRE-family HTH domain
VRPDDLGQFLRAKRALISPDEAGVTTYGRRRVPGLRREEVAQLAGVSTDYYVKLEQGRSAGVSDAVLDAICMVLRLDEGERQYLRNLLRPAPGRAAARTRQVRPGLRRLMESMPDVPAVIVGTAMNYLAWNDLGDALHDAAAAQQGGRTGAHQVFLDPSARDRYPGWAAAAQDMVGYLRFNAGRDPNDAAVAAVVGELAVKSKEFRTLWAQHAVRDKTHGRKRINHPAVGALDLSFEFLRLPDNDNQVLVTYTAEAGSPSEERLRLLASWSVTGPRLERVQDGAD